ncbi:MAG TPA: pentapeptide repeat-containing protein [Chthoniobacteraceae bacterium]|nr:pentapeptide repeat-containing protein [Chthoniobacteraceae bacterium]
MTPLANNLCAGRFRLLVAASLLLAATVCRAGDESYSKQDLRWRTFWAQNLKGARFDGANCAGAQFNKAVLTGASFKGANLQCADFTDAVLDDADFTGADLRGAIFYNAKAWRAKLAGDIIEFPGFDQQAIDQETQNYRFTFMTGDHEKQERDCGILSFHNADLRGAIILGNAVGVDFRGADLRGADLSHAIGLDEARLSEAKYDAKTKWPLDPKKTGAVLVSDDAGADGAK